LGRDCFGSRWRDAPAGPSTALGAAGTGRPASVQPRRDLGVPGKGLAPGRAAESGIAKARSGISLGQRGLAYVVSEDLGWGQRWPREATRGPT
jgi:hypothetical protein